MAPANGGLSPNHRYGSVDDPEQPNSHSSLLPRSSRCSISTNRCPATAGGQNSSSKQNKTNLRDSEGRSISRRLAVTVVCGLAFLAGSGVSWSRSSGSRSTAATAGGFYQVGAHTGTPLAEIKPGEPSSSVGDDAGAVATLEFTALNFYHVRDGKPGQDYPWLKGVKLIEPHRDTTLAVVGAREGFDYRWEVRAGSSSRSSNGSGGDDDVQATATGAVTIVVLTQLDENVVVLEEVDGDGKVTNRLEETVMVKYVRREIRTLTHDEREELLDAMFELWSVRVGEDGKERYGEDYADIYLINRMHYKGAAGRTCDYFHEGLGFLVSHSLITNTFEFSLQLVNPKLTVPYWDFTIETTAASTVVYDPEHPNTRTELLSPSWFGTADPTDSMVKDGRWAYTPIDIEDDSGFPHGTEDVYGKLRGPWVTNNRPYITRGLGKGCQASEDDFRSWPDCKIHYDLSTYPHDFYSWMWPGMDNAHGPVHIWLGGLLDCATTYLEIGKLVGAEAAEVMALLASGHRKNLFWANAWGCNKTANVDETPDELMSSGTCGCHGYDLTQGDDYKTIMGLLVHADYYLEGSSEDIQRRVTELMCSGVVAPGDQAQASSSFDPMFWPMHPTMERLWQFAVVTGQVTDFTWPDEDTSVTRPDGTTYTQYLGNRNEECVGHGGSDVFPYGLASDIDGLEIKTGIRGNPTTGNELTNREVIQAFDPRSNSMPYVYDTFKWDHCGPEGYDFDDAWGDSIPPAAWKDFFETDKPSAVPMSLKREMAERMKQKGGGS